MLDAFLRRMPQPFGGRIVADCLRTVRLPRPSDAIFDHDVAVSPESWQVGDVADEAG